MGTTPESQAMLATPAAASSTATLWAGRNRSPRKTKPSSTFTSGLM